MSNMKKWEEERRNKVHQYKIKSAKAVVNTRRPTLTSPKFNVDKSEMTQKPLKSILKEFGVQQYYRVTLIQKLCEEGYEDCPDKLGYLTDKETNELLIRLKVLPGHSSKFIEMITTLRMISENSRVKSAMVMRSLSPARDSYNRGRRTESTCIRPKYTYTRKTDSDDEDTETLEKYLKDAHEQIAKLEQELARSQEVAPTESKVRGKSIDTFQDKQKQISAFEECKDNKSLNKVELSSSYDSSKLRSTLVHLDVEEMCRCLSKAIRQNIMKNMVCETLPRLPNGLLQELEQAFSDECSKNSIPDESSIYNFSKNAIIRSHMEKEVSVICLAYIDKIIQKAGITLHGKNWKRILLTALILSSKVWDDESFENKHFASVFTQFHLKEINAMESAFLTLIDFEVNIKQSQYAKAYFLLRTYADSKSRSFPLQALDVESVRKLQSKSQKTEENLRKEYEDNLYKTM